MPYFSWAVERQSRVAACTVCWNRCLQTKPQKSMKMKFTDHPNIKRILLCPTWSIKTHRWTKITLACYHNIDNPTRSRVCVGESHRRGAQEMSTFAKEHKTRTLGTLTNTPIESNQSFVPTSSCQILCIALSLSFTYSHTHTLFLPLSLSLSLSTWSRAAATPSVRSIRFGLATTRRTTDENDPHRTETNSMKRTISKLGYNVSVTWSLSSKSVFEFPCFFWMIHSSHWGQSCVLSNSSPSQLKKASSLKGTEICFVYFFSAPLPVYFRACSMMTCWLNGQIPTLHQELQIWLGVKAWLNANRMTDAREFFPSRPREESDPYNWS